MLIPFLFTFLFAGRFTDPPVGVGVVDLAAIENAIAAVGYNANDTKADPKAYSELAMCCKVPGKE